MREGAKNGHMVKKGKEKQKGCVAKMLEGGNREGVIRAMFMKQSGL